MSIEESLKQLILDRYGSVREFTTQAHIPYTTLATIFKRGIQNAKALNVITICSALHISADALAEGKIVTVYKSVPQHTVNVEEIFEETKNRLLSAETLLLDGEPIDLDMVDSLIDDIDVIIGRAKRYQNRKRQAITKTITEP